MQERPIILNLASWDAGDLRYVCGIANAGGGFIVIDDENKTAVGRLKKIKKPFEQIPKLCEKELGLFCTTSPVLQGTTLCLEIEIPAAPHPVAYRGDYWLYSDGELVSMTKEELETKKRGQAGLAGAPDASVATLADPELPARKYDWELQPQPLALRSNLHAGAFLDTLRFDTGTPTRINTTIDKLLDDRLVFLGLQPLGQRDLTNATILMLHSHPEKFIPGATMRMVLISGSGEQISQHDELTGPLKTQLDEAVAIIFGRYLPAIERAGGNITIPPKEAVREVILNALAHRDYMNDNPVLVGVGPDRIDVKSPSVLDTDETQHLESFRDVRTPNPVIAQALRHLNIASDMGDVIARVKDMCEREGALEPTFVVTRNQLTVTIPLSQGMQEKDVVPIADAVHEQSNVILASEEAEAGNAAGDPAEETSEAQSGNTIHGLNENVPHNAPFSKRSIAAANKLDLTATDEYILRVLHTNGRVTASRISTVLGVSESTVRRSFRKLRENGLIERVGSDKAGYWRVIG